MKACYSGHAKVAKAILEFGATDEKLKKAEIDAVATDGWTAAHAAARRGDLETILLLHDKGADLSLKDHLDQKQPLNRRYGDTPLLIASFHAYTKVVGALLGAGVNWRETDDKGNNALHKVFMSAEGQPDDRDALVRIIMQYDGSSTASGRVRRPSHHT